MLSFSTNSESTGRLADTTGISFVHEGSSYRTFRLDDPERKHGGQSGSVAIKAFSDQFPDEEEISRLENEHNVLKYLANRSGAGAALNQTLRSGAAAIYLDWVEGITLKEWIRTTNSEKTSDLKRIRNVLQNITYGLLDIHDAGVVHNNIRAEHIIIPPEEDSP
eukprot:6439666-Ditylum_brightwellii.AAC.1